MTPERWQLIEELFHSALELDAKQRSAFLSASCAGDETLRDEVESLLAHQEPPRNLIGVAIRDEAELLHDEQEALPVEQQIGPYRIIRQIGRGGMGAVYLAGRDDDQYEKIVAVKLIRRGMDTDDILRRFRNERQILASLDHLNIARLLDGGTTVDGLPYFVMEYIEGRPLNEYCDTHKASTRERLALFRTVCSAIHYAHQNLVVHRDIKPGNILVTTEGVPKLLDFGIAKVLNPELSQTLVPTATEVRMMTPDYASPEQVKGEPITTSSDIYSLGVLLYVLLTGHKPYQVKTSAPNEILQAICEQEPEKPSTVITRSVTTQGSDGETRVTVTPEAVSQTRDSQPDRLRRQLAGDLDNIVLMAMRKEPARRYASVEQFSEDIRRHLDGLPVIARQDTFRYRTGKFVKRNRIAVTAAALFLVFLLGSVIAIVAQANRTARERDATARERDRATRKQQESEQVSAFLVDLFKVSDPSESRGNTVTAREVLDKGAERIAQELEGQPEVQATLMDAIGKVYYSLGLYDRARPLLEKALATRRQVVGNQHPDVARSLTNLADVLYEKGESGAAEGLTREALEIRRQAYGSEHVEIAESLSNLAFLLRRKGDTETAEPLYRDALAMRRKLLGNEDLYTASSLSNLGVLLYEKGDIEAAEPLYRESLEVLRKLYGSEHPDVALTLNNFGSLLRERGDYAAAESAQREALAIRRKLYGNDHPDVGLSLNNLGAVLKEKGDLAEAEARFREALALQRRLVSGPHSQVATTLNQLGRLLTERGEARQGEPLLREALSIVQKLFPKTHWRVAGGEVALGLCLVAQRRYSEAEALLLAGYQSLKASRGAGDKRTTEAVDQLIKLYTATGKADKAAEYRALLR